MKTCCTGCPFDVGQEATEIAYNLGCLPSTHEVAVKCKQNGTTWACHSAPEVVCCGYAEEFPERNALPLEIVEGVHYSAYRPLKI